MRRPSKHTVLLFSVLCVGLTIVIAVCIWPDRRPHFSGRKLARGGWSLAYTEDEAYNTVVIDAPSDSLLVVTDGQALRFRNWDSREPKIGIGDQPYRLLACPDLDLLVATPRGDIQQFKLNPGVAKQVYNAVFNEQCSDARTMILELYDGDDIRKLREAFGLITAAPTSEPGNARRNQP